MKETTLILYAKYPEPGKVKTRLTKGKKLKLSYNEASEFYHLLLLGLIQKYKMFSKELDIDFYICLKSNYEAFKQKYQHDKFILDKNCRDLGESLYQSLTISKLLGYQNVIFLGSDVPLLPRDKIEETIDLLENQDFIFGPDQDGGCYLIASNTNYNIFENIEWSAGKDFDILCRKCEESNFNFSTLSLIHDIDNGDDLFLFYNDAVMNKNNLKRENSELFYFIDKIVSRETF